MNKIYINLFDINMILFLTLLSNIFTCYHTYEERVNATLFAFYNLGKIGDTLMCM